MAVSGAAGPGLASGEQAGGGHASGEHASGGHASGERASGEQASGERVLIAVPFYKNEQLVAPLLGSLIACAADIAAISGEVLLYVDSPGHAALEAALADWLPLVQAAMPCRLIRNAENIGFVRTMNQAVAEAVARHCDLLLLNSDTRVEPGAFTEMARVLRLDHMTGFVNPRSNNATIATLPLRHVPGEPAAARAAYARLAGWLPAMSYVPTSVGFCMLIAWRVLAEFGGFDEIYGKGYNEENDLVMRAGRCGFRAVLANHAFVWHDGEESFSVASVDRSVLEPANRAILDSRYPEYGRYTAAYYESPEAIAEKLLAALLPDADGMLDFAFDFSSFRAAHNGTFQAGRQLLEVARDIWGGRFRIHVLCGEEVYAFHDYSVFGFPRAEPHGGQKFAAIFRVGQPYDWNVLQRLLVSGAAIGVYMLDTISVDCPQLDSPALRAMWQFTLDHVDLLATQSHQTQAQFALRFEVPAQTAELVSLHSVDIGDYTLPGTGEARARAGDAAPRLLVLGNHFHHKYLMPTANALAAAFPDRAVVALGAPEPRKGRLDPCAVPDLSTAPNVTGVEVGKLADADIGAQYEACDVVIFPSHAEGFGFPALNALAARRPLFVRRLPVFEELWEALGRTPNIHFYDTTSELIDRLAEIPPWVETPQLPAHNGTARSAREIRDAMNQAILAVTYQRITRRIRAMQLASALSNTGGLAPPVDTDAAKAARFLAERVEASVHRVLTQRLVYKATRLAFRVTRGASRLARGRRP
jgi:GT2 family glycosyltransferase